MGTRGAITVGALAKWSGVYNHWDSYPEGLGADVWEVLTSPDGIEKYKRAITEHPGGWSSFPEKCYCHSEFAQRDGSAAKDSQFYKVDAPSGQMTNENADALFIEWVYVLDENEMALHILESYSTGNGYAHKWVKSLRIGDYEPDWGSLWGETE